VNGRLNGKVALVTGAGQGIGKGIAQMFARQGAAVVATDLRDNTLQQTVSELAAEDVQIDSYAPCDLTSVDDVRALVSYVVAQHGRIDVLVNAGAIQPHLMPLEEMDYEKHWTPTIVGEIDVVFLLTKEAWPHLLKGGNSSIINFASVNAVRGSLNLGMLAHCAGKAAVMSMTRQLAIEGRDRIRANSIAPGMVTTPATQAAGGSTDGPIKEAILARVPRKRLGTPEDIAWAAVYLASDESSWVTGTMLAVDGGTTCC